MLVPAALGEQTSLHGARLRVHEIAGRLYAFRHRTCLGQRLLRETALGEEDRAHAGDPQRELGDSAPLAEVDPLPASIEGGLRPVVLPADEREVVVHDRRGAALTLRECKRERPALVLESLPVAEGGPGGAAGAESLRRLGQAELGGEGERLVGGRDRLPVVAADEARARQPGICGDELGAGRLCLEQRERLRQRLLMTWVAQ